MGKVKVESTQHQQKRENRAKIIVNIDLKHRDRVNKWAKAEQVQEVQAQAGINKATLDQFQKILAQVRQQQSRENQQDYHHSADFFKFMSQRTFTDQNFLKIYSKIRVVGIPPNQLEMLEQIKNGQELSYVTGKKIIFKSELSHIHIVKLFDQNKIEVEYTAGSTEGVNLQDYEKILTGLISGSEEGRQLFDEIVERWV
ncbi:Hypothetical_protein [Hexamita inflata]|nr:Hypothetical protein HINF_LOCUS8665 [Hexamita inflata]CAI9972901.1 Hypothetical protein HINF_LOCUS60546 [Hexamita inflata]